MKRRPPSLQDAHPDPDELARLVDADTPVDRRLVEHLATCRRCMAVYAEFVQTRSGVLSGAGDAAVPPAWVRRGLAVAAMPGGGRPRPQITRGLTPRRVAAVATAAALALLAATSGLQRFRLHQSHQVLAGQLREDSYGGLLYGEAFLPSPGGVRGAAADPRVERVLAELNRRDDSGPRSADDAFWLVGGFLARNDLDNADAHLREARRRFPDDDRLAGLSGLLAWKRNDLTAAATALESALARRRLVTHLYNLALGRRAQGDAASAAALARELVERFPGSPVAPLARVMIPAPAGEGLRPTADPGYPAPPR